jgi:hypothetical protein
MISWVIIGLLVVVGLVLLKFKHFRHRLTIVFLIFLVVFLYTTISIVNRTNSLDLTTTEGFLSSVKVYTGWLAHGFDNLKSITGNAVKMDWTSTNSTFVNKTISSVKK